jgi:hypothetical protein
VDTKKKALPLLQKINTHRIHGRRKAPFYYCFFFSALHVSWQKKHYPSEAQKRTQHAQNSTAAEISPTPPTD